jgi:hypothetical protein
MNSNGTHPAVATSGATVRTKTKSVTDLTSLILRPTPG